LALWLTGKQQAQTWAQPQKDTSPYELKAYVENIFERAGIDTKTLRVEKHTGEAFETALAFFSADKKPLGVLGVVSQKILNSFEIEQRVFYADLLWKNILALAARKRNAVRDLPKYPAVRRDLALLLDKNVQFSDIERIAYETERKLLKTVTLFDVYEGKNLEQGKKSYAISFILQDDEKTLTDKQIEQVMGRMQTVFETKLGAKLR